MKLYVLMMIICYQIYCVKSKKVVIYDNIFYVYQILRVKISKKHCRVLKDRSRRNSYTVTVKT